eukprot:m.8321 g.8321  ORF g.8321 m.8321 type:complete len:233 (+) comp5103_c0_seq1:114-812(+)
MEVEDHFLSAADVEAAAAAAGPADVEMDGPAPGEEDRPSFPALSAAEMSDGRSELRRIPVPPHRFTPLRENWMKIFTPIVEHMKLQIRMNTKHRQVEIKTCEATEDPGALQKAADFVKAFMLGFAVEDAVALLRLDELYLDSFDITDVKPLGGEHVSRAIGRIAGKGGKTKFTIENVTKTRIVLADTKIHILGAYQNIRVARDAIANLILGSPPGKVYGKLSTVSARIAERF